MTNIKTQLEEVRNSGLSALFEIEVINKDGEQDYILCDIKADDDNIYCERIAVTKEEEESKFIATSKIEIDDVYSLDEHLTELYSEVISDIIDGDMFALPE